MKGIYVIINKINNKKYVGQSNNIKRRFMEHKNTNKDKNLSITRAIKKYGIDNFDFKILHKLGNDELHKMNELEIKYINDLKPEYNRNKGGGGSTGHIVSENVRKILSIKAKKQWENMTEEEKKHRIKNNLTGRGENFVLTEEGKKNIIKKLTGLKQSEETILKRKKTIENKKKNGWKKNNSSHNKKVILVEENLVFESVKSVATYLNVHPSNVSHHLKGKQKTVKGKTLKYYSVEANPDECKGVETEVITVPKCVATLIKG